MGDGSNIASLSVDAFHGGMTDFFDNSASNTYESALNFFVTFDKKLYTRPGTLLNDDTYYRTPAGEQRIAALFEYRELQFHQTADQLYYLDGGFTELTGPSGSVPFLTATASSHFASGLLNEHLYLTSDSQDRPVKVFDDDGTFNMQTVGMPQTTHYNDAGVLQYSIVPFPGAAGALTLRYKLFFSYTYTVGTAGGDQRTFLIRSAPRSATFVNFGAVTAINPSTLLFSTGGPTITNSTGENYDWTNFYIEVYRQPVGGTGFYYVGHTTIANIASFQDTTTDANLISQTPLYTDGGRVADDYCPKAKYMVVASDSVWLGNLVESDNLNSSQDYKPNRLRQSLKFSGDSYPADFYVDFEEDITGLGVVGVYPIVFSANRIWRVEGQRDLLGRGSLQKREISRSTGTVGHNSIVNTLYGCFFGGNDGFYWTDGFRVLKLSRNLDATYASLVSTETKRKNMYGYIDALKEQIIWCVQRDSSSEDNDALFVLDVRWGTTETSVFTLWNAPLSWRPSCGIKFIEGQTQVLGDSRGYFFKFDSLTYTDPRIDDLIAPGDWGTAAIIYDYKSPRSTLGSDNVRKYCARALIKTLPNTNFAVQMQSNNDNSNIWQSLKEMRYDGGMTWGDLAIDYGSTDFSYAWGVTQEITAKRRMPKNHLRFDKKQIRITNSFTNIYKSDDYVTARVIATGTGYKTVEIITPNLPLDIVDYYISFDDDEYVLNYQIVASDDVYNLTILDAADTITPSSGKKWLIRGYRKGDTLLLTSYSLYYMIFSQGYGQFRGTENVNA